MDTLEINGSWDEQKHKLKEKFDALIDNLGFGEGKKEEIMENLQLKLGKTKEELLKITGAL